MTAVEFLSEQIRLTNIEGLRFQLWDAIEQAKEMEKKQQGYSEEDIALAFNEGQAYSVTGKLVDGKEWVKQHKKEWFEKKYNEKEVNELLQKALTHQDDGEIGSLVTAQGQIRTANFYSWFEKFKNK